MLRAMAWTLRQPRYSALAVLMFVIALLCVGAGTWQVSRYHQKVRENHVLVGNAHAASVSLSTALVPLAGRGPSPDGYDIRFRTVTVTGSYDARPAQFVRNKSVNGTMGFYVLNPLRTSAGTLLVVRGFTPDNGDGTHPPTVAAPPQGQVQVTGRLHTADTRNDAARALGNGELESINATEQAARLGTGVYDAYLSLNAHQPGTSGVTALPAPDLSNPAGGAFSWQNFAYIIQWYLFALLALAAPFVIGRAEVREARQRFLGVDTGDEEFGLDPGTEPGRQPQLTGATGGELALRARGTLARPGESAAQHLQRAERLADRYGRSLGPPPGRRDHSLEDTHGDLPAPVENRDLAPATGPPSTYRASDDVYRAGYNDYLWQLAMADGETRDAPRRGNERGSRGRLGGARRRSRPAIIPPDPDEQSPTTIQRPAPRGSGTADESR